MRPHGFTSMPLSDLRSASGEILARAVGSVIWTYVSLGGSKLLVFASSLILARLLTPAEFGQVGFALLVISYLDTIGDLGVSAALIYEQKRPEQAAHVAFIISLIMGIVWFVLAMLGAPLIARFFKDPAVVPLVRVLAWIFVLTALGNVHDALLRRELDFKQRLIPDLARALLKGTASVLLALLGGGVWSLVWGQLLGAAASTLALWMIVPWRPRWRVSWDLLREMLRYGSQIVSVNVLSAIIHHADHVIVGRLLGSVALGFYGMASRLPEFFVTMVIWVVGNIAFPAYARLQGDRPTLQRAFLVTLRYLSLVTVPTGVGLAVLGAPVILTLYGPQWEPSIPVLQALALAGCLRSLGSHAGDVYKAVGRPDILVRVGLVRAVVLVPTLVWGAGGGIGTVALAQLTITGASTLLNLYIASRVLTLPLKTLLAQFKPAAISTAVMLMGLHLLPPLLGSWPNVVRLTVSAALGFGIYATCLWLISPEAVRQARAAIAFSLRKAI